MIGTKRGIIQARRQCDNQSRFRWNRMVLYLLSVRYSPVMRLAHMDSATR